MYELNPTRVFVHKRVYRNPKAVKRLERMLQGLHNPPIEEVDVEDTDHVVEATGAPEGLSKRTPPFCGQMARQGIEKRRQDPVFLFNTFVWDEAERTRTEKQFHNVHARRIAWLMAGVGGDHAFGRREPSFMSPDPYVCAGGWGIDNVWGCVHKCDYCGEGYVVNLMLDLEDFAEHVSRLLERRPQQNLYRYTVCSDTICFEPEYGASEVLGECFSKTDDKYLLLYTKSNNVQHLLDLPYKEHTLFYLSLATDTVCRDIERDTPTMDERIEALRLCQEAGYVVRVGFSPIIPTSNWREEATECLEKLFARVKPETIRLWVVSMMSAAEAEVIFDTSMLDKEFVEAMRSSAPEMDLQHNAPFPPEMRAEIYGHYIDEIKRISPETPVSLCTEEGDVWQMLENKLEMSPYDLFCCCGGTSVPRT